MKFTVGHNLLKEKLSKERISIIEKEIKYLLKYGGSKDIRKFYTKGFRSKEEVLTYYKNLLIKLKNFNLNKGEKVYICVGLDIYNGKVIERTSDTITVLKEDGEYIECYWDNRSGCFRYGFQYIYSYHTHIIYKKGSSDYLVENPKCNINSI